jgi:hypothetical protein
MTTLRDQGTLSIRLLWEIASAKISNTNSLVTIASNELSLLFVYTSNVKALSFSF